MSPIQVNLIDIMKKKNDVCQYPAITDICLSSVQRVKDNSLTISIRKKLIWELLNKICNALFGRVIRNYRENNLKRCNDVNLRTEIAVKSESKHKS